MRTEDIPLDDLLEEIRRRTHPLEECENGTLIAELCRRIGFTDQDHSNLADCVSTAALVKELQNRHCTREQQMDLAELLYPPAQLQAMRLWLPMEGLDDEALWNSMSDAGRREHTKQEPGGAIDFLRQGLALLEP